MAFVPDPPPDKTPACEGCDGSGLRDPADPSCALPIPVGWHVVERCDACARFVSDADAARQRYGERFRIVACANGGAHVIVPNASRPGGAGRGRLRHVLRRIVVAVWGARS